MMNFLKHIVDVTPKTNLFHGSLLFMRIAAGFAIIKGHGWDKLFHFSEHLNEIPDPMGLGPELSLSFAVFADVFCALLVILGLFTRIAVLPILVTVMIGFFIVHGSDPWSMREVPFLYTILFVPLLILGPGRYSLDFLRSRKWNLGGFLPER
jgi:putative oxidoreductase